VTQDYEELCESLSMTEIIRLRDQLSRALTRRFEKPAALVFSDVCDSTPYFARFGDEAGRLLLQRHIDLIKTSIEPRQGRIVDTAGDGAFLAFPEADAAAEAMIELQKFVTDDNLPRSHDQQLAVRIGVHFGSVLTDGTVVTGDAVNFCARVASSAAPGEIRVSREAFHAFTNLAHRLQCRPLPPVMLKGISRPVELMALRWRSSAVFPSYVRLETGQELPIPEHDIITFGRLKEHNGMPANDIVLASASGEPMMTKQIGRWHFELRRRADGFVLKPVSEGATEVDGKAVTKGEEVPIRPGAQVRVGNAVTLTFLAAEEPRIDATATILTMPSPAPGPA
jgi:class 3 adenylate cyclase